MYYVQVDPSIKPAAEGFRTKWVAHVAAWIVRHFMNFPNATVVERKDSDKP
jgi:hypothetical protein